MRFQLLLLNYGSRLSIETSRSDFAAFLTSEITLEINPKVLKLEENWIKYLIVILSIESLIWLYNS